MLNRNNTIIFLGLFCLITVFFGHVDEVHASTSWYDNSWSYRRQITIDHTKVGGGTEDETDFPVLISLTGLSNINASGSDIRFTSSDGITLLPREIENYSGGSLIAWVKVPSLSHTQDTVIYMYYGNAAATEPAANSMYGSQNVWTNNFAGVWHLPNGSTLSTTDSTLHATNGTNFGGTATAGQVDGGLNLNGTQYIDLGTPSSLNITGEVTVETWIYMPSINTTTFGESILSQAFSSGVGAQFDLSVNRANTCGSLATGSGKLMFSWADKCMLNNTGTLLANTWYHIVAMRSGITGAWTDKLFINGAFDVATTTTVNPGTQADTALGRAGALTNTGLYFPGKIDETRISNIARSDGWISTDYQNQNSPGTFISEGSEQTLSVPGVPTSVSATSGNGQATVTFSAPASDGNSPITSYTISASAGGISTTTTTTSGVVTGLTNGATYTFSVTATNAIGTSTASASSSPITLPTIPDQPTNLAVSPQSSSMALSWSAPGSDGGSALTDYVVQYKLTSGNTWSTSTDAVNTSTTATVTGLSNGTSYDFRVVAVNAIGDSLPSDSVTASPGEPAQVIIQSFPDTTPPSISTAIRITNEGATDFEYQYTWCITDSSSNRCGGNDDIFSATAAKLVQVGQNFDTTLNSTVPSSGNYWFHIGVTFGSQTSWADESFTAATTVPSAPTFVSASAGDGQATVSFNAPDTDGGSAITSYLVTSTPGNFTATGNSSPITVTGLSNNTSYAFTVVAINGVGTSATSTPSNTITPVSSNHSSNGGYSSGGGGGGGGFSNPVTPATNYTGTILPCTNGALFNFLTGVICPVSTSTPVINNLLVPVNNSPFIFTRDLEFAMHSSDVVRLQQYLNNSGFIVAYSGPGSRGHETTIFGYATQAALIRFQKAHNIKPASGYLGPITRAYIAEHQ